MIKEILLVPGPALSNKIEITVMDFPDGITTGEECSEPLGSAASGEPSEALIALARKRCKITVEYGRPDVMELKKQGLDMDGALGHYQSYIYDLVKFHILSDWKAIGGLDRIMDVIKEHIMPFYEQREQ